MLLGVPDPGLCANVEYFCTTSTIKLVKCDGNQFIMKYTMKLINSFNCAGKLLHFPSKKCNSIKYISYNTECGTLAYDRG